MLVARIFQKPENSSSKRRDQQRMTMILMEQSASCPKLIHFYQLTSMISAQQESLVYLEDQRQDRKFFSL